MLQEERYTNLVQQLRGVQTNLKELWVFERCGEQSSLEWFIIAQHKRKAVVRTLFEFANLVILNIICSIVFSPLRIKSSAANVDFNLRFEFLKDVLRTGSYKTCRDFWRDYFSGIIDAELRHGLVSEVFLRNLDNLEDSTG